GRPAPVALPGWQQGAARLGQGVLYALLIAVPVLGFLSAAAAPIGVETVFFLILPIPHPFPPDQALYDVLRPLHQVAAWALVVLALGHGVLYVLLIAVPLLGFLSAAAAPSGVETVFFLILPIPHPFPPDQALYDVLRPLHQGAAWALVVLAAGHGAMAIHHHRQGSSILRLMWRGR
ncbi:MAG: cytochrome b, partial [Alphaproteobacteria bacterium]